MRVYVWNWTNYKFDLHNLYSDIKSELFNELLIYKRR
jgi:hypothetical protein